VPVWSQSPITTTTSISPAVRIRTGTARARDLLSAFSFIAMDEDTVEGTMNEPDRGLRSLDAIHLATARVLGTDLTAVVSYDDRLLKAAEDAGLGTESPRDYPGNC
jgi:predicted nucleic acid-binding protein